VTIPTDLRSSTRLARAKLNLTLAVTGRRPDGFHELETVMIRIGLSDVLEATPTDRLGDRLSVEGDPACPVEGNLVLRTVAAVRAAGGLNPTLDLRLTKRIPVGGGLAGGSADAAAALELLGGAPDDPGWLARLGADVPFLASGEPAALVSGVGERVDPLPGVREGVGFLLLTPPFPLETAEVFAAHDRLPPPGGEARTITQRLATRLRDGLTGAQLEAHADALRTANDLWPAAIAVQPGLARLREHLETRLGRPVLLTGSGSTLYAIYASRDAASAAATNLLTITEPKLSGTRVIAVSDQDMEPEWRSA
jgi:4-diphosphocytidyl-2-C-methyl-D-erythritol kinase